MALQLEGENTKRTNNICPTEDKDRREKEYKRNREDDSREEQVA